MSKLKQVLKKKNNVCQDSPESADDYNIELKDGDIIVSATDGVFDNLFQHEMLSMVADYRKMISPLQLRTQQQAKELSKILVDASIAKFKDPKGKKTPYQRKYKKTYNATWEVSKLFQFLCHHLKEIINISHKILQGGKEDDITVLVTVAKKVKVNKTPMKEGAKRNNENEIFTVEAIKDISHGFD